MPVDLVDGRTGGGVDELDGSVESAVESGDTETFSTALTARLCGPLVLTTWIGASA